MFNLQWKETEEKREENKNKKMRGKKIKWDKSELRGGAEEGGSYFGSPESNFHMSGLKHGNR